MTKKVRGQRREALLEIIDRYGLNRQGVADMLHISVDTVSAWLKPETSKSSNPVPLWALELLGYKMSPSKRKKRLLAAPADASPTDKESVT